MTNVHFFHSRFVDPRTFSNSSLGLILFVFFIKLLMKDLFSF